MFKGFNLTIDNISKFHNNGSYTEQLKSEKRKIKTAIDDIMLENGCIDAQKILNEWFPMGDYHVFISHSHKDIDKAQSLANWLYENFKIRSFIDSHIWGYANDLLYNINYQYARKNSDTFKYVPAISHAANVHLMLSTALNEAIDRAECLFFLNTNNSVQNIKLDDGDNDLRTASAWIMHELKSSAIMRTKYSDNRPTELIKSAGTENFNLEERAQVFLHQVSTKHLTELSEDELLTWLNCCNPYINPHSPSSGRVNNHSEYSALDILYHPQKPQSTNNNRSLLKQLLENN